VRKRMKKNIRRIKKDKEGNNGGREREG